MVAIDEDELLLTGFCKAVSFNHSTESALNLTSNAHHAPYSYNKSWFVAADVSSTVHQSETKRGTLCVREH